MAADSSKAGKTAPELEVTSGLPAASGAEAEAGHHGQPAGRPEPEVAEAVRKLLAVRLHLADGDPRPGGTAAADLDLVASGKLDEQSLLAVYAEASGLPVLDEQEVKDVITYPEVTYDFLTSMNCLPLMWNAEKALIAVSSPYQAGHLAHVWRTIYEADALFILARRPFIERFLTALYDNQRREGEGRLQDSDSEQALRDLAKEAPIVRLVNDIFNRAQEMGASDIHVEPTETDVAIRFRIDGLLQTILRPPKNQYAAIASRIKLLAGMNIAERRLPQDGRIDLPSGLNPIDVRVSTVPCMHGESIVLRLLQKDAAIFDLDKVGLLPDTRADLERLFSLPHGMILVVGPTGSGKTTTLYCIMNILNAEFRKIITIEDPVEYQLRGVNQIQVSEKAGLTFARGLRSILRHDPDVILVGEIRDQETAQIAVQASLTGHLVFSTLHTNDAPGALTRLVDMGVEPYLVASSLEAVLAQRLVRVLCKQCKQEDRSPAALEFKRRAGISLETPVYKSVGCQECRGTGFFGRHGIFEWMETDNEIRQLILKNVSSDVIREAACRAGMKTLAQDGWRLVEQGITTVEEVLSVTTAKEVTTATAAVAAGRH